MQELLRQMMKKNLHILYNCVRIEHKKNMHLGLYLFVW